jgi:HSP20 family molecular chaperone IbpA
MPEEMPEESGQLALDIIENDDSIIIFSPIAGIDLSDIEISYEKGVLKIE